MTNAVLIFHYRREATATRETYTKSDISPGPPMHPRESSGEGRAPGSEGSAAEHKALVSWMGLNFHSHPIAIGNWIISSACCASATYAVHVQVDKTTSMLHMSSCKWTNVYISFIVNFENLARSLSWLSVISPLHMRISAASLIYHHTSSSSFFRIDSAWCLWWNLTCSAAMTPPGSPLFFQPSAHYTNAEKSNRILRSW